jgi:hypothetical protein
MTRSFPIKYQHQLMAARDDGMVRTARRTARTTKGAADGALISQKKHALKDVQGSVLPQSAENSGLVIT